MQDTLTAETVEHQFTAFIAPEQVSLIGSRKWSATPISAGAVLLLDKESAAKQPAESMMVLGPDNLRDLLLGIVDRRWNGYVALQSEIGLQKLFFENGDLVFASSNLMDHRLGEVIYRAGTISLEKLTESAVKVNRHLKFGQVLISGGTFTNVDLWEALRLQILEILRSIFLIPQTFTEVVPGTHLAPMIVITSDNSETAIDEAHRYGRSYRDFLVHLQKDKPLRVLMDVVSGEGTTFERDMTVMVKENSTFDKLIEASKLHPVNTGVALMEMVMRGVVQAATLPRPEIHMNSSPEFDLKSKIDLYTRTLNESVGIFQEAQKVFPLKELAQFVSRVSGGNTKSLYLAANGEMHPESINWIKGQCDNDAQKSHYYTTRIDALIGFVVQVTSDSVSSEKGAALRAKIASTK